MTLLRAFAVGAIFLCGAACSRNQASPPPVPDALAEQGRADLQALDCGVCHVIPGVRGARGQIGPSLAAYRRRVYLAGKFSNTPENLERWILDAPSMAPQTAMPAIVMTEAQARNMAAYLYTLE